jgi:hypothetical protein
MLKLGMMMWLFAAMQISCSGGSETDDTDTGGDGDSDSDSDGDTDSDSDSDADGDVTFTINSAEATHPISPFIYGSNQLSSDTPHLRLGRSGGNRWTAYNWETNASNAGSDWNYSNDNYLIDSNTPGEAIRVSVAESQSIGAAHIVTVPMAGYVSADKNGNVDLNDPNHIADRFFETLPEKGSAFSLSPDTTDDVVYQDEFVNWLDNKFPGALTDADAPILLCLDNEPALWPSTHEEIHPEQTTYAEMVEKSVALSTAIKNVVPDATILGYVGYGWASFETLQDAPDANGNFVEFFLDAMRKADEDVGKRLMDVLDIHWYPEASGDGVRIVEDDNSAAVVEARLQAPRSLWDDSYTEESWITEWSTMGPISLIPLMKKKIAENYPDTKLSISEYNYGGPTHISGAIAEADALGIFGREGIFAAALWPLTDQQPFTMAGFDMYRDFDGDGGAFGDTSVFAETSDVEASSVYASVDDGDDDRMVVVAINKTGSPLSATINIDHLVDFTNVEVYQLTADEAAAVPVDDAPSISSNKLVYTMPALSVSTLVLAK